MLCPKHGREIVNDLFQGTTTDAVIDIFVDRLPVEAIRERFKSGSYGKVDPAWIKQWLALR